MVVDQPLARIARGRKIHFVFIDRRPAPANLLDEGQKRRPERHQIAQQVAAKHRDRRFEKLLGSDVGVGDLAIGRYHDHRMRQCVQNRIRWGIDDRGGGLRTAHAAAFQAKAS
jgi:hypothetical protein